MKQLAIVGLIGLAFGANAQTVFYGGDFDGRDGLAAQVNGPAISNAVVFDNFTLSGTTTISGVFGNFLDGGTQRGGGLYWEIRTGVSAGNGGTLVAGGFSSSASSVATGNSGFGLNEYHYEAGVSSFSLGAGTYWLGVAVDGGDGNIYNSTTSGTNGVGGPLADGNSYFNSTTFGANFQAASDFVGAPADFSMGLRGSSVPEPASMAALGLGALAMLRRRRK